MLNQTDLLAKIKVQNSKSIYDVKVDSKDILNLEDNSIDEINEVINEDIEILDLDFKEFDSSSSNDEEGK